VSLTAFFRPFVPGWEILLTEQFFTPGLFALPLSVRQAFWSFLLGLRWVNGVYPAVLLVTTSASDPTTAGFGSSFF